MSINSLKFKNLVERLAPAHRRYDKQVKSIRVEDRKCQITFNQRMGDDINTCHSENEMISNFSKSFYDDNRDIPCEL